MHGALALGERRPEQKGGRPGAGQHCPCHDHPADSAHGSPEVLGWLVYERGIEPHIRWIFSNSVVAIRKRAGVSIPEVDCRKLFALDNAVAYLEEALGRLDSRVK